MSLWVLAAIAFSVTLSATPLVIRALSLRHLYDRPNERSMHVSEVPRGGGYACIAGVAAATLAAVVVGKPLPWPVVLGALLIGAVGAVDDRRALSPLPRLAAQAAVGAFLGAAVAGLIGAVLGAVTATVIVNVFNFMDGINGIAALTVAVWGLSAVVVGARYGALPVVMLGAIAGASAIGFLPWNAPTARIFLGDVGSYFLGMLIAGSLIASHETEVPTYLLLAPLLLHIFDVFFTLMRRALRRASLLSAHREHVYQRTLLESGWPHVAVSGIVALLAAVTTFAFAVGAEGSKAWFLVAPFVISLYAAGPSVIRIYRARRSAYRFKEGAS